MSANKTRRWVAVAAMALAYLGASAASASTLKKLAEELRTTVAALSEAKKDFDELDFMVDEQAAAVKFLRKLAESTDNPVIQQKLESAQMELKSLEVERAEVKAKINLLTRRIVELKIKEQVRHHGRQKRRAVSELSRGARPETRDFVGRDATPSAHAIAHETQAVLLAAMETLPPGYRDVLRLVHDQGFTVEEAATALGRTPAATRKLYSRAIGRLGQVLKSKEERR